MQSTNLVTTTMLAICAALLAVVVREVLRDTDAAAVQLVQPALESRDVSAPPTFDPPPRSAFAVITEHPLFSPTRRPFTPPSAPVAPIAPPVVEEPARLEARLRGVMLGTRSSGALLELADRERMVWLRKGETFAGWAIEIIEPKRVLLRQRRWVQELRLQTEKD